MNVRIIKILAIFLILFGLTKNINADEPKPSDSHQFNFFSGVFAYTDEEYFDPIERFLLS